MKFKDKQINSLALLVSLLIHAALFMQFSNLAMSRSQAQAQAPTLDTRISLNLLPPVKQQRIKQEEIKKVKPKKVAKKNNKKKIKKQKTVKPKPKHEQIVAPKIAQEIKRKQAGELAPIRQQYFLRLLTHIEGFKYYPRIARKRGIEGSIKISFRLLPNGSITGLIASGYPLMLRRAAKKSVKEALPLPACPNDVICPMQISYAMKFKLN